MRENNFSIPSANKASVGITPALYDRRALDCTSTLPLINSLNNLAYLTTSSARIRDILTVDGGVERLVCILKEGRSKDAMDMWKWNLAFQCVVNIGVRGSENVRTRVVEADMVPVVATILDNYIRAIEKCREKETGRGGTVKSSSSSQRTSSQPGQSRSDRERSRRQAPPPIEIPTPPATILSNNAETRPPLTLPSAFSSPPDTTPTITRPPQLADMDTSDHRRLLDTRRTMNETIVGLSPFNADNTPAFGTSPAQDNNERLSTLPTLNSISRMDLTSQPTSPSTPSASRSRDTSEAPPRRPSIRHQLSVSESTWDDEEQNVVQAIAEPSMADGVSPDPTILAQTDVVMRDVQDMDGMPRGGSATPITLSVPTVTVADTDNYMHPHDSGMDDRRLDDTTTPNPAQGAFNPAQTLPPVNVVNTNPPSVRQTLDSYYGRLPALPNLLSALPRDEDVIMALQLLAYVSKYCNLRSYFQSTRLVARLKVGPELEALEESASGSTGRTEKQLYDDWDNEFVVKPGEEPYNIFPLIEKFTVRAASSSRHALHPTSPQQSETMQYWAGVVMRNLCRKDEAKGGIRQCAYWKCGKWEQFPRQFAKCRRCRRTKYCSKECQKGAWGTHRFWCVAAEDGREGEPSTSRSHHHHHHHHHHHRHERRETSRDTGSQTPSAGPVSAA